MKDSNEKDPAQERLEQLLDRHVGFEWFDPKRAILLPKKTYVALHGRFVLLGFPEQSQADQFFQTAIEDSSEK
jgi:hypothetical protein